MLLLRDYQLDVGSSDPNQYKYFVQFSLPYYLYFIVFIKIKEIFYLNFDIKKGKF